MAALTEDETISSVGGFVSRLSETSTGKRRLFRCQNTTDCLLPRIMRLAEEKGISPGTINDIEQKMLERFRRESVPMLRFPRELADWELLSIAQHWGMPPRLLDWTANPLAALWFGVCENPRSNDDKRVVWIVDEPNLKKFNAHENIFTLPNTCFFEPPHIDRRIAAESAWFSVYRHNRQEFLSLDGQERYEPKLKRFFVPRERFKPLQEELSVIGINHASMYPDLLGLGKDIQREFIDSWRALDTI